MSDLERYDRQRRIPGWNQEALQHAVVIVAGAGALGNEILQKLALLGVGHLLVVDFDRVEWSNLGRTALFREEDVGRSKAETAANAVVHLNPSVQARFIHGNLFHDVGLGFYRHAQLVLGGLDNLAARSRAGLSSALAGLPFFDAGMWALGGEVRFFDASNGPCFECTLSEEDRVRAFERLSCSGFQRADDEQTRGPAATTVTTAAIIAGVQVQEAVRYLSGHAPRTGEAVVYSGMALGMHRSELSRNPVCPYHRPYEDVLEMEARAATTTPRDLLTSLGAGAAAVLELGRDFLLAFHCPHCGATESVDDLVARVSETRLTCPRCGSMRRSETLSHVGMEDPCAARPLALLGVPPGEVLAVRSGENLRFVELTGDVTAMWGREQDRSSL